MTTYKKRYLAVDDSEHPCCFGASVVDTTKVNGHCTDDQNWTPLQKFERVCECLNYDTARRIEAALNNENAINLSQRLLWCNTHQRRAERCKTEGGILLPCRVVDLTDEIEFIDEDTNINRRHS